MIAIIAVGIINPFPASINPETAIIIMLVTNMLKPDSESGIINILITSNITAIMRSIVTKSKVTIDSSSASELSSSAIIFSVSLTTVSAVSFSIDSDTTSSQTVLESSCALSAVFKVIGIIMSIPTVKKQKIPAVRMPSISPKNNSRKKIITVNIIKIAKRIFIIIMLSPL